MIKFKMLKDTYKAPEYKTAGAGCADVYLPERVVIPPSVALEGKAYVIPLGFTVEVPKGYTARLNLRSSVFKDSPLISFEGIIDEDFKGEVCLYVKNLSNRYVYFEAGTRLCQIDLAQVIDMAEKPKTVRGTKSGSTGK